MKHKIKILIALCIAAMSFTKVNAQAVEAPFSFNKFVFTGCGLDYATATKVLNQRTQGQTPAGNTLTPTQPLPLLISGIPLGAHLQKAYLWMTAVSDAGTFQNLTIATRFEVPNGSTIQHGLTQLVYSDYGGATCWHANDSHWEWTISYVVDVTAQAFINSGNDLNGTYYLHDITGNNSSVIYPPTFFDVNGVTLMLIYDMPCNTSVRPATLQLWRGLDIETPNPPQTISYGDANHPLPNNNLPFYTNNTNTKGFMLFGDVESNVVFYDINSTSATTQISVFNTPPNHNRMHNFVQQYSLSLGSPPYLFSARTQVSDCYNVTLMGLYAQDADNMCSLPSVTINPNPGYYCIGSPGITLTANVTGGTPPFTFSWSPCVSPPCTSSTLTVSPTVPGPNVYTVTVADAYNCTASATTTVEAFDQVPFTLTGPQNNCLDADGISNYTLVPPAGYGGPVTVGTPQITGMTNYSVSFTGLNGQVDYSTATITNGAVATLCVPVTTVCGTQDVCIPIYQCCQCWGGGESEQPEITLCKNINNLSASDLLNLPSLNQLITNNGNGYTIAIPSNTYVIINGTFTVDVNFTFEDCPGILMGPDAKILIKQGKTLTLSSPEIFHTSQYQHGVATEIAAYYCGIMWDGIYFEDGTAQLIINPPPSAPGTDNYVSIHDAKNAIVSDNGARFTIRWGYFYNNNKDIVVNTFIGSGSHQGTIEHSSLTSAAPMLPYYTFVNNTPTYNSALPRTHTGIQIANVDEITIGPPGQPADNNTFSNMDLGIVSYRSILHSKNNWFNNIRRISTCSNPLTSPCPPEGVCIYASTLPNSPQVTNFPTVDVGGSTSDANVFNNVDDGVYVETQHNVSVGYNSFTNLKRAVYATRSFHSIMDIGNNTIDQFGTGVWIVNNPACDVSIHDNIFNGTYSTIQSSTAIRAEEPMFTIGNSPVLFHIHDNTIRRIRTGILTTNLYSAEINHYNDIMFETTHPNSWSGSYGIRVQNNYKSLVQDNTIYRCVNSFPNANPQAGWPPATNCFPTASTPSDYTNSLIGISMERNSFCNINNNSTAYLGTGIRNFSSYVANTYSCNTMAYCQWMLWLDNSNPGQQGSSTTSQGNQWRSDPNTGFSVQYDIYGPLPTPAGQSWYFNPSTQQYIPAVQFPFPTPIVTPLLTATNPNTNCSYPAIIGNDPGSTQKQLAQLLQWTQDESCTLTDEGKFIAQVEIYKELLYDNSLMNLGTSYDSYLQEFYNDNAGTDIGIMAQVRYDLDAKDYDDAKSSNSTVTPDNEAEANEKATNEIYLDTWAKDIYTFTQQQYSSLSDIAVQNPISGGPAVYTARVMLGVDYDDFGSLNRLSSEKQSQESYMNIYPNPASNELNLDYSLGENGSGIFTLCDVTGREALKQNLNSGINKVTISTKHLEQGVYFAQIKVNDEILKSEKVLIVK